MFLFSTWSTYFYLILTKIHLYLTIILKPIYFEKLKFTYFAQQLTCLLKNIQLFFNVLQVSYIFAIYTYFISYIFLKFIQEVQIT